MLVSFGWLFSKLLCQWQRNMYLCPSINCVYLLNLRVCLVKWEENHDASSLNHIKKKVLGDFFPCSYLPRPWWAECWREVSKYPVVGAQKLAQKSSVIKKTLFHRSMMGLIGAHINTPQRSTDRIWYYVMHSTSIGESTVHMSTFPSLTLSIYT
ncbi:hypothetical protein HAX54_008328 [Datura stramonium]|uniref:Uncharacterized protein n=1 Tax=Datura stramonium TaxID=4076 RepID=A0ABS8TFN7_DATST|nr:hypothetical protein [Datura stramonium]